MELNLNYAMYNIICEYKDAQGELLVIMINISLRKTQHCTGGAISGLLASPVCGPVSVAHGELFLRFS